MATYRPSTFGPFTSVFLWLLLFTHVTTTMSKIRLVNNGYEGVVIAINPDVSEDEMMPKKLETILSKASAMLFRATRNRLFFKEFIVVLPEAWKHKPHYHNALDEQLEKAQIIIDRANPAYGNAPYVKQFAKCGKSGLYIHLTPDYILDDKVYRRWGRPEKTMVHEWAHLRWGLFDEYPIDAEDAAYYLYGGQWFPTRCSNAVKGSLRSEHSDKLCKFDHTTGTAEKNCRFYPDRMTKEVASLMFVQYLENVVEFCDDPKTSPYNLKHNAWAPNRQNRLCNYKSAWEVMRTHDDFNKDTKELPRTTDTQPIFKYVQVKQRKRVLVLDTSGSMTGTSLNVMKQAASNYILSSIEDGSQLGIVQFSTDAAIVSHLQDVKSEKDRERLIDCLPKRASGKTSIGSGLQKGIEVLTASSNSAGGTIILITDGKENQPPFIAQQQDVLVKEGIVVHALAYGQKAEGNIASLAADTGGNTFFYSGNPNSTALIDGLSATVEKENGMLPSESVSHSILTNAGLVSNDVPFVDSFYIDSTIGRHTSLTFSYTEHIEVTISGPNAVYTADTHDNNFPDDTGSKVLKVSITPDPSTSTGLTSRQPGKWTYSVSTNTTKSFITVNVQSKARHKGEDIIKISSWIADEKDIVFDAKKTLAVYAEVLQGKAPLLNAEVLATIERPKALPFDLLLLDNGIGADIIKSDGVYSTSILAKDMMGNGRYNIKVKVVGTEARTRVVIKGVGTSSGALETDANVQAELITAPAENFQRVTTAGEFRLKGFPTKNNNSAPVPDVISPARIADFRLKSFDYERGLATVTWTSVGGDMERGAASQYVIFISEDFYTILWNTTSSKTFPPKHVIQGKLDIPLVSGEIEEFVLRMKSMQNNETVYLIIIALDDVGNAGEASNVISISPGLQLSVPRFAVHTDAEFPLFVVGIVIVIVFLAAVIILGTCLVIRSRKIKSEKIQQLNEKQDHSQSRIALDLAYMNYMFDGEYRKRMEETPETWNIT